MKEIRIDRRKFIARVAGATAAISALPKKAYSMFGGGRQRSDSTPAIQQAVAPAPRIKFAVIGVNHSHINSQVDAVLRGGGELALFYAKEPDLAASFSKRFPQARLARSEAEILEDPSIQLVVSAAIPSDRAPLGIRVMQHGKDYMSDKPGITSLEQLAEVRRVQKQTNRIYSIMYSERFENKATVKAGELVKAGAIGKVIQTIGLGPHRISLTTRPQWFFDKKY